MRSLTKKRCKPMPGPGRNRGPWPQRGYAGKCRLGWAPQRACQAIA